MKKILPWAAAGAAMLLLTKGSISGVGSVDNIVNFTGQTSKYDLSRREQKLAYQVCYSCLANNDDYRIVTRLYNTLSDNLGWTAMAAICGYITMKQARDTTPQTNECTIWSNEFAAYLLVGELSEISKGHKSRSESVREIEYDMEIFNNMLL